MLAASYPGYASMISAILTAHARRVQFSIGRSMVTFCVSAVILMAAAVLPQERFSIFVPTDQDDVPRRLELAGLHDGDATGR